MCDHVPVIGAEARPCAWVSPEITEQNVSSSADFLKIWSQDVVPGRFLATSLEQRYLKCHRFSSVQRYYWRDELHPEGGHVRLHFIPLKDYLIRHKAICFTGGSYNRDGKWLSKAAGMHPTPEECKGACVSYRHGDLLTPTVSCRYNQGCCFPLVRIRELWLVFMAIQYAYAYYAYTIMPLLEA